MYFLLTFKITILYNTCVAGPEAALKGLFVLLRAVAARTGNAGWRAVTSPAARGGQSV